MSGLFGGGPSKTGYQLQGGGTNAPWNWGVSDFDRSMINQATTSNTQAMDDRYAQLGLGGSTMQGQDVAAAGQMGEAMTGQLQTANEANPALNPAMQPELNSLIGVNSNQGAQTASTLGSLSSLASKALGGTAGTAATAAAV